jgi:hypothetical protein
VDVHEGFSFGKAAVVESAMCFSTIFAGPVLSIKYAAHISPMLNVIKNLQDKN